LRVRLNSLSATNSWKLSFYSLSKLLIAELEMKLWTS
jgi:hypothetical protein